MVNSYFYSNTAVQTSLTGAISAGTTMINVGSVTGFPSSFPYILALDFGSATEELVSVTAAAATTLTVTRGFGSTSATSHSIGAVVRHVYNAVDATDFRTHEASTGAVHGLTGNIVGTSDTQTLTNKTLTSPTINNGTYASGGSFAGTFTGTPTLSGNVVFSGAPSFTGAPTFSGGPLITTTPAIFQGAAAGDDRAWFRVAADANPRFTIDADGRLGWGPGTTATDITLYREAASVLTTDDIFRVIRPLVGDNALSIRIPSDTTASHWFINADGAMWWGPGGTTATDTNLFRDAANTLRTNDNLTVDLALSVGGNVTHTGTGIRYLPTQTGQATVTFSASVQEDTAVVFGTAFSGTPRVTISVSNSPAGSSRVMVRALSITTTGFTARFLSADGTSLTTTGVTADWHATAP